MNIDWINQAGDESLGLLHKVAFPQCMIDFEHCHKKPCPCGCDNLCKRCAKEIVYNNGSICEKCVKQITKAQLDLEELLKEILEKK